MAPACPPPRGGERQGHIRWPHQSFTTAPRDARGRTHTTTATHLLSAAASAVVFDAAPGHAHGSTKVAVA